MPIRRPESGGGGEGEGGRGIIATSASGCYFNVNTIHSHLNIHILLESPTFPMVG